MKMIAESQSERKARDDKIWRDMVISVRDRIMTKDVYEQLRHSLRECMYNISKLGTR